MNIFRTAALAVAALGICACTSVPHKPIRYVQTAGGSEVGSFSTAAPLNGAERMLSDQNGTTVDVTPAQIGQYLGISNALTFPIGANLGGTGATSLAGADIPQFNGMITPGDCVEWLSSTVITDAGAVCGSGGGGSGTISKIQAGSSGSLTVTNGTGPTTTVDLTSQSNLTLLGNDSGSSASPVAINGQQAQSILVQANFNPLTPATLSTGTITDYDPNGFGPSIGWLVLTPPTGGSSIAGVVAGTSMHAVVFQNAEAAGGNDAIELLNQSSTETTAANRFLLPGNYLILPGDAQICFYLGSASRWAGCH